jgi:plasmid stabilization system protein ParE
MPIRWTELAIFDLEQAREYIMQTSPEKAIAVIDRIENSLKTLQDLPQMGRPWKSFRYP